MQYSDTYCSLDLFDTQLKADSLSLGYLPQRSVLNGEHAEKIEELVKILSICFSQSFIPLITPFCLLQLLQL